MSEIFDIVICGAGPAGSTCALALANSGLKVALLEKDRFPRDKVCGDAIAGCVPEVLNTIDPSLVKSLEGFTPRQQVDTVRVFAPNEKFLDLTFKTEGCISKRMDFDNFLFEQASKLSNVTIFQNTVVKNVIVNEQGLTIDTSAVQLEAALINRL